MDAVFDVVDMLQLHEVWARRPIVVAVTRLAQRQSLRPTSIQFSLEHLRPRLSHLRNSAAWRQHHTTDPAQRALVDLSDEQLSILYPDNTRHSVFKAVYDHYLIAHYRGELQRTRRLMEALAATITVDPAECFGERTLPAPGSNFWIPAELTDEVRALNARYRAEEPDTPAACVVAEDFWVLLHKAEPDTITSAVNRYCAHTQNEPYADTVERLSALIELARLWHRSPSVVGIYYQEQERNIHD